MYSIRKIKELKNYRFFQNYKWDEGNCKFFNIDLRCFIKTIFKKISVMLMLLSIIFYFNFANMEDYKYG